MDKFLLKGAVTEVMATFAEDESFDYSMYADQIDFQLDAGIKGIFLNGLAGEYLYTTYEEKVEMSKVAVKKVGGKVPVVGNIAEMRPCDALKLLRSYEDAGVDAICITQPMVLPVAPDMMVKYYSDLAAATKMPVYVYNAPQTSNTMSPGTICKIVNENKNVVGYKDSTQDIIHLQSVQAGVKKDRFECISGSDATIFPTLAVGGCGIISLISAVFPKPILNVCDLYFAGDVQGSFEMQQRVLKIRTALKNGPFLSGYKYAASLIGLSLGSVREPLCNPTDKQKEALKQSLEKLDLI